jgi:hypothetical protein
MVKATGSKKKLRELFTCVSLNIYCNYYYITTIIIIIIIIMLIIITIRSEGKWHLSS